MSGIKPTKRTVPNSVKIFQFGIICAKIQEVKNECPFFSPGSLVATLQGKFEITRLGLGLQLKLIQTVYIYNIFVTMCYLDRPFSYHDNLVLNVLFNYPAST